MVGEERDSESRAGIRKYLSTERMVDNVLIHELAVNAFFSDLIQAGELTLYGLSNEMLATTVCKYMS